MSESHERAGGMESGYEMVVTDPEHGQGVSYERLPSGVVRVQFVTIDDPADVAAIPNLWPTDFPWPATAARQ